MSFIGDRLKEADEFEEEGMLICNRFELAFVVVVVVCEYIVNY